MAATSQWFGQSATALIARQWPTTGGLVIGVMLMKPAYTPNIDTQMTYADVSSQELAAGGGYTVGGQIIPNRTATYDAANDEYNLNGDDISWGPGATFDTTYGIIYEQATANKYLWALLNFGGTISVSSGIFQIDWTSGLLSVKAGPAV